MVKKKSNWTDKYISLLFIRLAIQGIVTIALTIAALGIIALIN